MITEKTKTSEHIGQSLSNAGLDGMLRAAEINEFCEQAFGRSADMGDLRIFDFARLVEREAIKREREACAKECDAFLSEVQNRFANGAFSQCADAIRMRSNKQYTASRQYSTQ